MGGVLADESAVLEQVLESLERVDFGPQFPQFLLGAGFQPVFAGQVEFAKIVEDAKDQLDYLVNDLGLEFVDD